MATECLESNSYAQPMIYQGCIQLTGIDSSPQRLASSWELFFYYKADHFAFQTQSRVDTEACHFIHSEAHAHRCNGREGQFFGGPSVCHRQHLPLLPATLSSVSFPWLSLLWAPSPRVPDAAGMGSRGEGVPNRQPSTEGTWLATPCC